MNLTTKHEKEVAELLGEGACILIIYVPLSFLYITSEQFHRTPKYLNCLFKRGFRVQPKALTNGRCVHSKLPYIEQDHRTVLLILENPGYFQCRLYLGQMQTLPNITLSDSTCKAYGLTLKSIAFSLATKNRRNILLNYYIHYQEFRRIKEVIARIL